MRKKLVLSLMMAVIAATSIVTTGWQEVNVLAADDGTIALASADVIGNWYSNVYGVSMSINIKENGSYDIVIGDNNKETGKWTIVGENLIMDSDEDEMALTYDNGNLKYNVGDVYFMFSQDESALDGFTPADVNKKAKENDFDGVWKAEQLKTGKITAEPDIFGIANTFITIKDGKLDIYINSDVYTNPLTAEGLEITFKDGAYTFDSSNLNEKSTTTAESSSESSSDDKSIVSEIMLLKDGMLSMTLNTGGEDMIFYMTKSDAAEFKAAKRDDAAAASAAANETTETESNDSDNNKENAENDSKDTDTDENIKNDKDTDKNN